MGQDDLIRNQNLFPQLAEIPETLLKNIHTGIPLIYELDEHLKPIKNYYLGDPDEIKRATQTVARQGKV